MKMTLPGLLAARLASHSPEKKTDDRLPPAPRACVTTTTLRENDGGPGHEWDLSNWPGSAMLVGCWSSQDREPEQPRLETANEHESTRPSGRRHRHVCDPCSRASL